MNDGTPDPQTADAPSTRAPAGLLPAGLAPWAAGLSALTPGLALALGPLVRGVDALIVERAPRTAALGEPDGYGGLGRRGRPDRLWPSEWLLADEWPEEFVRRHADGELLYAAPEFRRAGATGRVVALVDTGPRAAGAARLVQLAALVALHRRAGSLGTELAVRVLGDRSSDQLSGELPELLPRWLDARRDRDPDAADVAAARAALDAPDEAWLLTTPALAALLPGERRTLAAEPTGWGPAGATRVRLALDGATSELPLPSAESAIRLLRGAGFRRVAEQPAQPVRTTRLPVFNSLSPTLLTRGGQVGQVVATKLRKDAHAHPGRSRTHGFGLPVLAAAQLGRRLVALVDRGRDLQVRVVGRPLQPPGWSTVDRSRFGLDRAGTDALLEGPLLPLTWQDDVLAVPVAGRWWSIAADGEVRDNGPVSEGGSDEEDGEGDDGEGDDGGDDWKGGGAGGDGTPGFRWAREPRLYGAPLPPEAVRARHRLYAADAVAWSQDGERWGITKSEGGSVEVVVPADSEAIGLVRRGGDLALITCSPGGRLVRSVRPDGSRVLSRVSGGAAAPSVHPGLPLVAAEPVPGRVVVGDALTGQVYVDTRSPA